MARTLDHKKADALFDEMRALSGSFRTCIQLEDREKLAARYGLTLAQVDRLEVRFGNFFNKVYNMLEGRAYANRRPRRKARYSIGGAQGGDKAD